ncbi:dihydrodipicolinate synthase family protein [Hoeflea prorocentri]|uniref:Dihydrodipicolinate synthase family protein n=1 Tax=Hoeflea prorocentri TaxID=1922333 RepID=A0A9X3ZGE2_9HYPH|nr:dihydrodipicolinate synthase family protein [Hoeflea prorocentri]MCY6380144.1 dihydrodipicolinate synthase family protein [Hoeflea prorocentri]MDA5397944.1 dihydrodipicolinate synthase family protein [Hoeflea prorocentri]
MQGVIAAVPTPISPSGEPVRDLFVEHCRWALDNGCDGLNILGSTGEANSFATPARKSVMSWAASDVDTASLMVGTGTPSLAETIDLTSHADDCGYGVALVLPPYYYKPVSDDGLVQWYANLHEALGERQVRIYFYNFPQMTGITISPTVIERLHQAWPHRFCGIKDSSGDLDYCRNLVGRMPDLDVFPSSEVALSEAAASGFAGCISATVNETAPLCADLWAGRSAPDTALVQQISGLRSAIAAQALIPSVKSLVAKRTGEDTWKRVLPPFQELTSEQFGALSKIVGVT